MKSSIPQIVLTGSSGFLGQYLLHSLIQEPMTNLPKEGLHVHALYGGMEGFEQAVQQAIGATPSHIKVEVHKLDLTNTTEVNKWMDQYAAQIDVCVHTAALSVPRLCQADPTKAQALNVPTAFLEGLVQQRVKIVALSTDQVYDGTAAPYKETDPVRPLNLYGKTKVELEELLTKSSSENNQLPMVLLRSSIMLGPKAPLLGDKSHSTFLHFCATQENMETTFWTDECRSVLAVDNVVDVVRWFVQKLLLEPNSKSGSRIYNLGGPTRQSRMDMAQAVFAHFNYATDKLIAAEKAKVPPDAVPSPLDITMDSRKLVDLVQGDVKWKTLDQVVNWTFNGEESCGASEVKKA